MLHDVLSCSSFIFLFFDWPFALYDPFSDWSRNLYLLAGFAEQFSSCFLRPLRADDSCFSRSATLSGNEVITAAGWALRDLGLAFVILGVGASDYTYDMADGVSVGCGASFIDTASSIVNLLHVYQRWRAHWQV